METLQITLFLSLRGKHDRSNLLKIKGLFCIGGEGHRSEWAWLVLWIHLPPYPNIKAQYLFSLRYVFLWSA